jgi:hypothetical protein
MYQKRFCKINGLLQKLTRYPSHTHLPVECGASALELKDEISVNFACNLKYQRF